MFGGREANGRVRISVELFPNLLLHSGSTGSTMRRHSDKKWPTLQVRMGQFVRVAEDATELGESHGYDLHISPDDLRRHSQGQTF